jgi:hypothetical protein
MKKKTTVARGRKKTDDPKIMVPVWVNKSMIKRVGGMEAAKAAGLDGIRQANNAAAANVALGNTPNYIHPHV